MLGADCSCGDAVGGMLLLALSSDSRRTVRLGVEARSREQKLRRDRVRAQGAHSAQAWGAGIFGSRGQGAQKRRHRLPLQRRDRVASTAPAYSMAATLGFIAAVKGVGVHAPAVLLVAFVPMLLVASAYKYFNRADPDAGTTFA